MMVLMGRKKLRKISGGLITALSLMGALTIGVLFTAVDLVSPPTYSTSLATVTSVTAKSWLVLDMATGETITSHNANEQLPIASLTKLMTASTYLAQNDIWATTSITWADINTEGDAGSLRHREVYSLHTLLFPMLLESSNDAAAVYSRVDPDLINKMNANATRLGLTQTQFADSSGLSADNKSTAVELAALVWNIYHQQRHIIDITSLKQYLSSTKGWLNNNRFINDKTYVGGKNGYIPEAGRTMIAIFDEELKNGTTRRLAYILLNSDNTQYDMGLLRDYVKAHVRYE